MSGYALPDLLSVWPSQLHLLYLSSCSTSRCLALSHISSLVLFSEHCKNCAQASVYKYVSLAFVVLQVSDPYKRVPFLYPCQNWACRNDTEHFNKNLTRKGILSHQLCHLKTYTGLFIHSLACPWRNFAPLTTLLKTARS
jgi:hypothetical protein